MASLPANVVQAEKYDGAINIRCPAELPQLVASAARANMTSSSSYVRVAVLERLRRDRFDRDQADQSKGGR